MKTKILFFAVVAISISACRKDIVTKNTPEEVFLAFWKTLDENYVFFEEKGLNWDSVYSIYYPQAQAAKTDKDLFNIFTEIIPMFKDRHVLCQAYLQSDYSNSYDITCDVDFTDVVRSFFNYIEIDDYMDKLISLPLSSHQHKTKKYAMISLYSFGNFQYYENRNTNLEKFVACLNGLKYSDGLIINLIDSGGGHTMDAHNILSLFFTDERIIYYDVYKTGAGHNDFSEKIPVTVTGRGIIPETVPIIVLTSAETYSASNIFAYVLKDLPNCTFVGKKTGGGGGTVRTILLPNSWMLQHSYNKHFSTQGELMEYPLMPDIYVKKINERYNYDETNERDVVIRAIEVLDSINGF